VRALPLVLLALSGVACGGAQPAKPPKPTALRVIAVPETARVSVDEQFVGAARVLAVRPKPLGEGAHRVTVEAQGYFPHDLEVTLQPGVTTIEVKLRPIPP
jgi:hypothetical protein